MGGRRLVSPKTGFEAKTLALLVAICLSGIGCGRTAGPNTNASATPTLSSESSAGGCASTAQPIGRLGAALVYDAARGQLVMFGGDESTSGSSNSTWLRTGNCWTEIQVSVKPPR